MTTFTKKKKKRSNNRWLAVQYQLQQVAQSYRMSTLVLADDMGLLVSAADSHYNSDAVAAFCPLEGKPIKPYVKDGIQRAMTSDCAPTPPRLTVQRFSVNGSELFLAGAGKEQRANPAGLSRAMKGVSRILST